MAKTAQTVPWRKRFHLQYAPVVGELPALVRLQGLKPSQVLSPQSVLIVNCSLIGDFVLSLPALADFIRDHSAAQIDLLVSPPLAPLAGRIRGIRKVYAAQTVFGRATELSGGSDAQLARSYDQVIVLRCSEPARRLLATTSYRAIRTYLFPFLRYGLHLARQPSAQVKQMSEFNFEIFGKAGRNERRLAVDDVFDLPHVPAVTTRPERTVLIHTGSGSKLYLWPVDNWVALLENLQQLTDLSFIFVGGTEEEERTFEEVSQRVSFPIQSIIRQSDLLQLLMLMRASDLFVGVDSGPRHLAHLVDLPSVSLLGPGPKSFQPLNLHATVIDETECPRCVTFYCPFAVSCVGKIKVGTVARACREKLNSAKRDWVIDLEEPNHPLKTLPAAGTHPH